MDFRDVEVPKNGIVRVQPLGVALLKSGPMLDADVPHVFSDLQNHFLGSGTIEMAVPGRARVTPLIDPFLFAHSNTRPFLDLFSHFANRFSFLVRKIVHYLIELGFAQIFIVELGVRKDLLDSPGHSAFAVYFLELLSGEPIVTANVSDGAVQVLTELRPNVKLKSDSILGCF
jgi:hypothetical protein